MRSGPSASDPASPSRRSPAGPGSANRTSRTSSGAAGRPRPSSIGRLAAALRVPIVALLADRTTSRTPARARPAGPIRPRSRARPLDCRRRHRCSARQQGRPMHREPHAPIPPPRHRPRPGPRTAARPTGRGASPRAGARPPAGRRPPGRPGGRRPGLGRRGPGWRRPGPRRDLLHRPVHGQQSELDGVRPTTAPSRPASSGTSSTAPASTSGDDYDYQYWVDLHLTSGASSDEEVTFTSGYSDGLSNPWHSPDNHGSERRLDPGGQLEGRQVLLGLHQGEVLRGLRHPGHARPALHHLHRAPSESWPSRPDRRRHVPPRPRAATGPGGSACSSWSGRARAGPGRPHPAPGGPGGRRSSTADPTPGRRPARGRGWRSARSPARAPSCSRSASRCTLRAVRADGAVALGARPGRRRLPHLRPVPGRRCCVAGRRRGPGRSTADGAAGPGAGRRSAEPAARRHHLPERGRAGRGAARRRRRVPHRRPAAGWSRRGRPPTPGSTRPWSWSPRPTAAARSPSCGQLGRSAAPGRVRGRARHPGRRHAPPAVALDAPGSATRCRARWPTPTSSPTCSSTPGPPPTAPPTSSPSAAVPRARRARSPARSTPAPSAPTARCWPPSANGADGDLSRTRVDVAWVDLDGSVRAATAEQVVGHVGVGGHRSPPAGRVAVAGGTGAGGRRRPDRSAATIAPALAVAFDDAGRAVVGRRHGPRAPGGAP